jgi:hypothetical protein
VKILKNEVISGDHAKGTRRSVTHLESMNRRRSERVPLQIRVIVETEVEQGKLVRLDAFTLVVNAHGGLLEMSLKVPKGHKLMLANPAVGVRQACRVVEVRSSLDGFFAVTFEFDSPTPDFWPLAFCPTDWGRIQAKK